MVNVGHGPLGIQQSPILGLNPEGGFTSCSLNLQLPLENAQLSSEGYIWMIDSFIHWFTHSIHAKCIHPTFILPQAKL